MAGSSGVGGAVGRGSWALTRASAIVIRQVPGVRRRAGPGGPVCGGAASANGPTIPRSRRPDAGGPLRGHIKSANRPPTPGPDHAGRSMLADTPARGGWARIARSRRAQQAPATNDTGDQPGWARTPRSRRAQQAHPRPMTPAPDPRARTTARAPRAGRTQSGAGDRSQRRGRDSNPRWTEGPQRFSRPPRSTTPAPLRGLDLRAVPLIAAPDLDERAAPSLHAPSQASKTVPPRTATGRPATPAATRSRL